jgi:hypothetical protein
VHPQRRVRADHVQRRAGHQAVELPGDEDVRTGGEPELLEIECHGA